MVSPTEDSHSRYDSTKRPLVAFFVLAFLLMFGGLLVHELGAQGVLPRTRVFSKLAGFAPTLAAIIVTLVFYGRRELGNLIRRFLPWSAGWWILFCLFVPPAVFLLNIAVLTVCGFEVPRPTLHTWPNWIVSVLTTALLGAGLAEEVGWRGFALPHLQRSQSALKASLVVGVIWAVWHYPHWYILFGYSVPWLFLAVYSLGVIALSVVLAAIFNSTNGSVFAVVLLHGSNNASWSFVTKELFQGFHWGQSHLPNLVTFFIYGLIGLIFLVAFGPGSLAPRTKQMWSSAEDSPGQLNETKMPPDSPVPL